MRRMKIRAKPNFGIGGAGAGAGAGPGPGPGPGAGAVAGASRSSLAPGKGSGSPVETQGSQIQIASSPVKEEAACSSPAADTDKPSGGSEELTSGPQGMSSDVLCVDLQESTNKSCDNATTSAASQMNTSEPSPTSVSEGGEEEHQRVGTDSKSDSGDAVLPSAESRVTPKPLESDVILVPTPQTQPLPVPQESPGDVPVGMPPPSASVPTSDTSSNVSKEMQQDADGKSAVSMRRKKLKVKPMLGSFRKGSVTDKAKVKAADNNTDAPMLIKSECLDVKPTVNPTRNDENVSTQENIKSNHQNVEVQERADTDADTGHVFKKPNKPPPAKTDPNKKTSVIPESTEDSEKCHTEKEVLEVRQDTKLKSAMLESTRDEVEVVRDDTDTPVIVKQTTTPAGDNLPPQTTSSATAATGGYKRRARIRAKPTLITKKRKEDDKDVKMKPVEQTPAANEPLKDASPQENTARRCDTVELDADGSESHQVQEECKFKPNSGAVRKEVKFGEAEANRKPSHLLNITDTSKESKEAEQKIKREGIHTSNKGNAESPLQSILKTPRKKKLSENKEIDPELEVVDVVNISVEKQGKKRVKQDDCVDVVNSDDSTGDKENASTPVTEPSKQERGIKENSSVITQKAKTKSPVNTSKLFGKFGKKPKVEDDADSPDKAKKQVFRARKNEFRKKMSKGSMERSKMTMFDLIYWNPSSNPMPGSDASPKENGCSNSKGETDSVASEAAEEQRVDELGLDAADSEHQSRPESPEVVTVSEETPEKPDEENKDSAEEEKDPLGDAVPNEEEVKGEKDIFAPRVKIGPNGEMMVDEQSVKLQTTAAKNRDEVMTKAVVMEESGDSSHYGKWSKRRRRSCEWTVKETALFYKALSTVGTDFSLMETLIKWRSRAELKTKFKKEERNNRDLVDLALNDSTQFDMTVFEEESDYDPKEDRKAARQAERAEAKRRRLAIKQEDKTKAVEKKKLAKKKEKATVMNRKKVLRKAYKNRGRKRKEASESDIEDSPSLYDSESGSEESVLEQPQPGDIVPVKPRVTLKRRQDKRRNSLVISEVTVTMETIKYEKPANDKPADDEGITERTVQENQATPEFILPLPRQEVHFSNSDAPDGDTRPSKSPASHGSDELFHREKQENEINILDENSRLSLNEELPESHIIENLINENPETTENADGNSDIRQMDDVRSSEASTSEEGGGAEAAETTTELQPYNPDAEPEGDHDSQRVWHFPVSAIQTAEDGQQVIVVPTSNGQYSVPVPVLPPGTSNVVVMATDAPDFPGELIYHVYLVSPLEAEAEAEAEAAES